MRRWLGIITSAFIMVFVVTVTCGGLAFVQGGHELTQIAEVGE